MAEEQNSEMVHALRLAVQWQEFKAFCKERSNCKNCPYCKDHTCSYTSTEKILTKIAEEGRSYLIRQGIPISTHK